ncbi:MAG: NAD(+)/NADH kinase [Rikenellaceae bacterium]
MLMQIAIYTRGSEYLSDEELRAWLSIAAQKGVGVVFNETFASEARKRGFGNIVSYSSAAELPVSTSLVVSYGGDGTLLKCAGMLSDRDIPIMGVNSGRLGFLANVQRQDVCDIFNKIESGDYIIDSRSVIVAEGLGVALNEFTIQREGLHMVNIKIRINSEEVAEYQADGLVVATPTGSTAYAMSLGGPIVAPTCDCMVILPIAPHNLTIRPLVVDGSATIEVSAIRRAGKLIATLDNEAFDIENGDTFIIKRQKDKVKIAEASDNSFYKTIRNKLMWGIDSRKK